MRMQARLFYPLPDRILIWEGPAKTFFVVEVEEIKMFENEVVKLVSETLGATPKMGRWEK
jgi:hypothetical protein